MTLGDRFRKTEEMVCIITYSEGVKMNAGIYGVVCPIAHNRYGFNRWMMFEAPEGPKEETTI